jgi:hypothetical protein
MHQNNDLLISYVTVRLKTVNSSIGTGVICFPESNDKVYVLTASHCLFEDGEGYGEKRKNFIIDIYNPQQKNYESISYEHINDNLLFKDANKDVAILLLEKETIDKINPNIPRIHAVRERHSFSSFVIKGFPNATKGEELTIVAAEWRQEMTDTKRFQLQLVDDYTGTNVGGFSGAGVFLEANNEVHLYGIFTRFRGEEKGKVIYCQYISGVDELLRKNFLPPINYTYLGENGLNPLFLPTR